MKYAIPTDDGKTVSSVFGRAASFAIYEAEGAEPTILPNDGANSEHGAGTGAATFLAERGVGTVIAPDIGPKAQEALVAAGIKILGAQAGAALADALRASSDKTES